MAKHNKHKAKQRRKLKRKEKLTNKKDERKQSNRSGESYTGPGAEDNTSGERSADILSSN